MRPASAAATPAPLGACLGVAFVLLAFAGCDEACPPGYGTELDQCVVRAEEAPPHPCDVLPRSKADDEGSGRFIRVNEPEEGCFWMDETEVVVSEYQSWVTEAKTRAVAYDADWCRWKRGQPLSDPMGDPDDACAASIPFSESRPFAPTKAMRCVDFCDAQAFCNEKGKRLCFGGGRSGITLPRTTREWTLACTNTLTTVYPFGNSAQGTDCNVAPGQGCVECRVVEVGRSSGCKTPSGIADLVGNVAEWTEACNTIAEGTDPSFVTSCLVRGGSFATPIGSCDAELSVKANVRRNDIGFRCCRDLDPSENREVADGLTAR